MTFHGNEKLASRVPELNSAAGQARLAAYFIGVFALTTAYFIITDRIPTWTLDSQIVVMALGYLILSRFFTQKKSYIERYKESAYRHAFWRFAIPGLAIVFAALAHIAYMNGPKFTQPTIAAVFTWAGWVFVVIGAILWIRAASIFGFDNLTMLYVYFPEEGSMVNTGIYRIIRHPVYGAALRVAIGLALLNRGIYPVTFVILLPLFVFGWLRLVEEKDLLESIPEYAEYRRKVPAFFPYPNRITAFIKYLLTGK
jgi:protein-S-isoprenylcysteine O-methyltransferase Ste14